ECQNQRISAACARHGMARAAERRELGFESAHLGPQDELTMTQHARDRLVDRSPEASALRSNVDERNWHRIEAGALIHRDYRLRRQGRASADQPPRAGPAAAHTRYRAPFEAADGDFEARHPLLARHRRLLAVADRSDKCLQLG